MRLISSHPLPYHNPRPVGQTIDTIVIHSMFAEGYADPTSLPSCIDLLSRNEVAAHYAIGRDGELCSLVPEELRAWHAGKSVMPFPDDSRENVNDFSIGIELVTSGYDGHFLESQYLALTHLIHSILSRHPITAIVGHEHIAPVRKVDPGPHFDWSRLTRAFGSTAIRFPRDP